VENLIIPLIQGIREKSNLDPSLVEEIILGNVLHPEASWIARASALAAGFPATTATSTVSRWCSSGLLAVQSIATQIQSGCIDIGIAVGAESMSTNPDNGTARGPYADLLASNPLIDDTTQPMPWTAENVARDFNVTRARQDDYAAESVNKAERAQSTGLFDAEILPIRTRVKDSKSGTDSSVLITRDDGIRYGTTAASLSKIRPAFPQWPPSTTTGGNASQVTDGAAAVLLMRRSKAEELGQPILAKFVLSTVVGLEPRIMGIGPSYAIPKLLSKVGLSKDDVDVFEINEAFASMLVYCVERLGLDRQKVNPRGGAIALGHPLGATGARQIVTSIAEMKHRGSKIAVTSMCVGTGMGMASLLVNE
jgi:acetyl-CoA acyltransferase 1